MNPESKSLINVFTEDFTFSVVDKNKNIVKHHCGYSLLKTNENMKNDQCKRNRHEK